MFSGDVGQEEGGGLSLRGRNGVAQSQTWVGIVVRATSPDWSLEQLPDSARCSSTVSVATEPY